MWHLDQKEISSIINNSKFDIVMHFAGLIRVDESIKEPEKYNEYNFTKASFFDTCFKNNLKKVVFSSLLLFMVILKIKLLMRMMN